ncbi:MAG: SDR family oxidoreductase [Blastocatellia bacterium]|nr:SDR family oxidoreductase [Blastocatellia bacterium]
MNEKKVLITGSSSGFGRELVTTFLGEGWTVLAALRDAEHRAEAFEKEMSDSPDRLTLLSLDVSEEGDRVTVARFIEERLGGKLDCLINNAGFGLFGALEDLSEQQIRHQMEVNFFGLVLLTRKLLPYIRNARGRIINISSVLGYMGMPLATLYCASKHAVEGFSEALYHELKPHGVQVGVIEPGAFRTSFGRNQVWGEGSFDKDSPYLAQTESFSRFREKRSSGPGNPIDPVIAAVMKSATSEKVPFRVRCGRDALVSYAVKRLLSESKAVALFSRIFRRAFSDQVERT